MKKRWVIATLEAHELQKQINKTKHERGRKLLESRITKTYLESWVDLDNKEAILVCAKDYVSDKVKGEIDDMCKSILTSYSQIKKVDVYGYSAVIETVENGEMKFPPKSSIIQPEIVSANDNIPSIIINGIDEIHCDKETREDTQTFFDLRDSTLQQMGREPTLETGGDIEAGEIRIIVEAEQANKDLM